MTSPSFTERRLYRNAAILQAFQPTPDVPVDNFSTIASRPIWARVMEFNPGIVKDDPQGTTGTARKRREARYLQNVLPTVRLMGGATPKNLEWLLRSWGGNWTGGPTLSLNITEQINELVTLGLVEKVVPPPNPQQFVRIWDAWAWRIELAMLSGLSTLDVTADFAARDWDRTPLNALPPIVLPVTFAPPAIDVFAPHSFRLYRDPAGANVSIAIRELKIVLEHGLLHETWNDRAPQVVKEGYTRVLVSIRSIWQDENYAIEDDAEAQAIPFKRFSAEWTNGAKNFKIDMRNVDFLASPTGWSDGKFREFTVEGEAYLDDAGNYVNITLTP